MLNTSANGRTLVDIIQKGNQELFHSSVIAWLLTPDGEHGAGDAYLQAFAARLGLAADSLSGACIRTEAPGRGSRYDIRIDKSPMSVIIENKWKAIGAAPQLDRYVGKCDVLVALGLTELSFGTRSGSTTEVKYLEYRDLLDLITKVHAGMNSATDNEFDVLVRHYAEYLERELGLLDAIDACYMQGEEDLHEQITEELGSDRYNENDRRFANRHLLERFRRESLDGRWTTQKNHTSGVWLADYREPWSGRALRADLRGIAERYEAKLWVHIELNKGLCAESLDHKAGFIQLRSNRGSRTSRELCKELRNAVVLDPDRGERQLRRPSGRARTFGVFNRPLLKRDLFQNEFEEIVHSFQQRFAEA